jgi:hypothetical protein
MQITSAGPGGATRFPRQRPVGILALVASYDTIGATYSATRHPDPRIAAGHWTDGFAAAYWRRPEAYLDPEVRAGLSILAQPGDEVLRPGPRRLAADLDPGQCRQRHRDLLGRADYDGGYRLLIAEQPSGPG